MSEDTMICPICGTEGAVGAKCFNCGMDLFKKTEEKIDEEVKILVKDESENLTNE